MSIHKCLPHHIHMTISHFTHPPTATLTSWQLLEVSASLVGLEMRNLLCQDCSVLGIFHSHLRKLEVRDAKLTTTCRWGRGSWDCQCNASLHTTTPDKSQFHWATLQVHACCERFSKDIHQKILKKLLKDTVTVSVINLWPITNM